MTRGVCLLIVGLLGVALAWAQLYPSRQPKPQQSGPKGEAKLRWICKQLQLDEMQRQQAEALIPIYDATLAKLRESGAKLMEEIQALYTELREAIEAGDKEREKELRAQLADMAPLKQAEKAYFDALEQVLTEEQKAKLPEIRKRAETVGDIAMRPVHVLRAARKHPLTREQHIQLEKVLEEFRASQTGTPPQNEGARSEKMDQLTKDVRAILTAQQAEEFDKQIADLRDGAPAAERFEPPTPPTTQEAEQPEKKPPSEGP